MQAAIKHNINKLSILFQTLNNSSSLFNSAEAERICFMNCFEIKQNSQTDPTWLGQTPIVWLATEETASDNQVFPSNGNGAL